MAIRTLVGHNDSKEIFFFFLNIFIFIKYFLQLHYLQYSNYLIYIHLLKINCFFNNR